MPTSFLMCRPKYYEVTYVINPWMEGNVHKTNPALATQQWNAFYEQLKQAATVKLIEPQPNLPDLVFTANAGLLQGKRFVLSHFHHPERQPEEPVFKRWFEQNGFEVLEVPEDIFFEGAGDGLFQPGEDLLWMGHGIRSDLSAKALLEDYFSAEIIPLQLINNNFYHLDTCFCPLLEGYVMYFPSAFDQPSNARIEKQVPKKKRIVVSQEDALNFCCNAVLADRTIFINAATDSLRKALEGLGYTVLIQPVTEFNKAGGANKCLTLELEI